ncbi:MAG: DUF4430 domain-containing protein [Candidatus Heimdallarchaeum aukensis]|uniref:DUF4430 domain-containing protein n=1 Tax=Candidatus Heimdallarchaeum aukensis TaxID=2876573 RepID=A0A9Y1FKP6_9ARCH|nr:MAG: DUF4430 domain-containing protein [Candidatus Heimdallarchaeum aukensis]
MKKYRLFFAFIGFVLIASIIGGTVYYFKFLNISNQSEQEIQCQVIIEYGTLNNNTIEEYNITIKDGSTAFDAFSEVASLDVVQYPFGVYIRAVNGFEEQPPNYWAFYYFDSENLAWIYSEVGVSNYYLSDGDKVKLSYTG